MFRGALFVVYFPFNMLFMLFFAVQLVNALATCILFHFNVKKCLLTQPKNAVVTIPFEL